MATGHGLQQKWSGTGPVLGTAVALWLCTSWWGGAVAASLVDRYPGAQWDEISPEASGWSASKLSGAQERSREIGSSAVVVVQHGLVVASWGEPAANIILQSVRKSLLSALIGIAVAHGQIDLRDTLAKLGIDDDPPPLTSEEKQATIGDLLEARSGVYHGANYETAFNAALRPPRGSHPPGTHWYYNNWDFNALGAIYERATGKAIFEAFREQIARPIGMQDYDPRNCTYVGGPDSIYPAYVFFSSARDLARFGLLYLHRGRWGDHQIIPSEWIDDSIKAYSATYIGSGYGYLWWTSFPDHPLAFPPGQASMVAGSAVYLPPGSYFAWGNGGKFVFVIPSDDLVIVHLARNGVELGQMASLLTIILEAADGH